VADAAAAAAAARLPLAAESGGGDAKRRVEFDAPASEAKRRGKEKGPRSKVKRKAAGAEPAVVVDAEQEAARLREARARLTEEMAARRALRAGMGRATAWAQACRSDPWPAAGDMMGRNPLSRG
jgi:hypothetical protein